MSRNTKKEGLIAFLFTSVGKKYVMALSGLFLCLFLVVHLIGNLQLLKNDGGEAFNTYSYFMTHNPLIKIIAYANYAFILLHAVDGTALWLQNKNARPVNYATKDDGANSSAASRNMIWLGSLILFFLVIHMGNFWYKMKFGSLPEKAYYGFLEPVKDLYSEVITVFQNPIWVGIYLLGLVSLAFHLQHGFQSAFQSLGLRHKKYLGIIVNVGFWAFGILIPLGFAIIPLFVLFTK